MNYPKILTIQDISCVGQCSLTVGLPILSACKIETCILPSAVLSTHTAGFKDFTFRDLTEDIPLIKEHWIKEGIKFDAIYTGYLGSIKQINYVMEIMDDTTKDNSLNIVDPAMADNGNLYSIFNLDYVEAMKKLCVKADIILPNITEACFLTGVEYTEKYDEEYINLILDKLDSIGCKKVILTGVSFSDGKTGVMVRENGNNNYYEHEKISKGCHGTGDVYAASFVGALMNGFDIFKSASIAANYVVECIKATIDDESHWYGVKFELKLPYLISELGIN